MRLIISDTQECFSKLEYDAQECEFELSGNKGGSIYLQSQLKLIQEYDPVNYTICLLNNSAASENSIYRVHCDNVRVGMMFPVQALMSSEHDYAENEFFLRYAYVAMYMLIEEIVTTIPLIEGDEIYLDQFYEPNQQILILDKENIKEGLPASFSVDECVVSLYDKGYSFIGERKKVSKIEAGKNLKLKSLPVAWGKSPYIITLFKDLIPKETNALAKFHILYQCIEIMITLLFKSRFKQFVEDLKNEEDFLLERREELDKMLNEKSRVKILLSSNCALSGVNRDRLNGICKRILSDNKYKTSKDDSLAENLYSLRCLIVHNMYVLSEKSLLDLEELVDIFEDSLIEIVMTFKL